MTIRGTSFLCFALWPALYGQTSPLKLAQTVVEHWSAGNEAAFASVYPFREGRNALAAAGRAKSRPAGLANVVRSDEMSAVLAISGVPALPNSGDATVAAVGFSGIYEARNEDGIWRLKRQVPLQEAGRILAHDIKVQVRPGSGIAVDDRIRVRIIGRNGFAMRLNYSAKISSVRTGRLEHPHLFGGGLLWIDVPEGETELQLAYSIDVEKGPEETNSACFLKDFGHVRNQYLWHPTLGFDVAEARVDFHIQVRIPKEYEVSTSLPQTESMDSDERIVDGRTVEPALALTLVYDRAWKVERRTLGDARVEFFLVPDAKPGVDALFDELRGIYDLLAKRFGPLPSKYFAIIQARSWKDNPGWRFNSNHAVVGAAELEIPMKLPAYTGAGFGHEVAHFWSQGAAGPAQALLNEGWASWAESAILERELGADTAIQFLKSRAGMYLMAYDDKTSPLEDENNGGIGYAKGPWVFRMLEEALGQPAFDKAMAEYFSSSHAHPAGWELLAECAQRYAPAGFDARTFVQPWLAERRVPELKANVAGTEVKIRQDPPVFSLPLTVEVDTEHGRERRRVWTKGPEITVSFSSNVTAVRLDPEEKLLLRR